MNCRHTCRENFYGYLCENKCDCNATQICHHACGCLQKVDSSKNDSSMSENLKVSYYAESCPTSVDAIVISQGVIYFYIIFIFIFSLLIAYIYRNSSHIAFVVKQQKQVMCVICMLTKFSFLYTIY